VSFEPPQSIESQRLLLRLVRETDIPELMSINGDEEVTRFLPYATWKSLEDGKAWFDRVRALSAAGATLQFVVVERPSGRVIGTCLLFRYDKGSARAELGYVMGRADWRKGLTHEALAALITYAFDTYELRRIEAEVNPRNIASSQLVRKLGFACEGLLRKRWFVKGESYDTNIYGLLREEWRPKEQS
jgi:RimJ/RimL family protein N-acetyltransferase